MSKNVAMFVDVANMYYAARGQDVDVDYVALLKHATKGRDLIRAYAYTGLDPENENQRKFIDFLAKNGYKPVVKDIRKFGDGRMKANLDIELVVDLFRLADRMDIAVIVSGDGDFAPAIRALQDKGVRAEVISFKPNTSSDLVAVADEFTDIMKIASIGRGKTATATRTSMSAPEMPAKEVSPEFGFREASPSVAAAALAAIKTGGSPSTGRTRGGSSTRSASTRSGPARSSTRRAAEPEAEAAAEAEAAPIAAADSGEEVRRRRRRRGGRGRGRARRDETDGESAPTSGTGEGEIGWQELDSLSQVDGLEDPDHEYSFEEADEATLAALGIDAENVTAAEPEPKPRRTRSRKSDSDAAESETKPSSRSGPKTATDGDTTPTGADEGEAEKPKRTRSSKTAKGDEGAGDASAAKPRRSRAKADSGGTDAPSAASSESASVQEFAGGQDGEPQGIWGRFRSARKPRST